MLSSEQIQSELELIVKIDRLYRQENYHSPADISQYQARQARKKELLEMMKSIEKLKDL